MSKAAVLQYLYQMHHIVSEKKSKPVYKHILTLMVASSEAVTMTEKTG